MTNQDQSNLDIERRRDEMLQVLLADVRRERRHRQVRAASTIGLGVLLTAGAVVAWRPLRPVTLERPGSLAGVPEVTVSKPTVERAMIRAEFVGEASIHARIVPRGYEEVSVVLEPEATVRSEWITTEQAFAMLQSSGQRYGIIERGPRVEFVRLVAAR
jgi:hypothetical protein